MMKLKHLLSLLLGIGMVHTATSQVIFKLSSVKFTEDIGFIYRPAIGLEVETRLMTEVFKKSHFRASIGVFSSAARMKSFPSYAIGANEFIGGTPQTMVVPTTASYSRLFVIPISINYNYFFLEKDFSPFIRTGVTINAARYNIDKAGGFIGGNEIVEIASLGANVTGGLNYKINEKMQIQLSLGKNTSVYSTSFPITFWQTMIGVEYDW